MSGRRRRWNTLARPPVLAAVLLAGPSSPAPAPACPEPYRVSRAEILRAMSGHGAYSLTSTTTSLRFGAEALLALVRRRQEEAPGSTHLFVHHADWFAAHRQTAGVEYAAMSESARAGYEHAQDALVDYGPRVVERVVAGPPPRRTLDVTIFWPDTGDAPREFTYRDTLSDPRLDVFDRRVIRFTLLEYDDMLVFDRISGISVKPLGFLSAVFAVLGKPDLRQTRLAVSGDQWQVVRGRVNVFAGISKTGTAAIEPGGRGHEGVPGDRADLRALADALKRPVEVRYGPPSCRTRLAMRDAEQNCRGVMGGVGECVGP